MNLPLIPHDKANHATYGAALSLVGLAIWAAFAWFLGYAAVSAWVPAFAGVVALPVAIGALKEVRDRATGTGTPDPWDFVATVAGGAPAAAAVYVVPLLMR